MTTEKTIALIGLGYVGLPLAVAFAQKYRVVGFDINETRIRELMKGIDHTLEVDGNALLGVVDAENANRIGLYFTSNADDIRDADYYIVTVPTPIDKHKRPNLSPVYFASETVGKVLSSGNTVIYESTVYPGVTEEECVPILERVSGLKLNSDFYVGYSPERINPGDKTRTLAKIQKVTSGSTPEAAENIDRLYASIIPAGTFKAPSIKVAEAAKVIENAQRDINIAFVNELAKIFNRLGIDTNDVLRTASTKWNFLNFKPGLVGGHCIGVDPHYLAQKAEETGYHPEIILAGRRINDGMGEYVGHELVKLMIKKEVPVKNADVLVLGITFKENCPDVRNTKVVDILKTLEEYQMNITIYDPWADPTEVAREYKWTSTRVLQDEKQYDAILLTVAHQSFNQLNLTSMRKARSVIYDVKGVLPSESADARL